jgi:hypothetical protein
MVAVVVGVGLSFLWESHYPALVALVAIAVLILNRTWWRYRG